jgi:hypothetical protein
MKYLLFVWFLDIFDFNNKDGILTRNQRSKSITGLFWNKFDPNVWKEIQQETANILNTI